MSLESKQFNFMLTMTAIVVLVLVGAAVYALVAEIITWKEFAAAIAPIATGLTGYWLRGGS